MDDEDEEENEDDDSQDHDDHNDNNDDDDEALTDCICVTFSFMEKRCAALLCLTARL